MDSKGRARRRTAADVVVLLAAVFSLTFAIWAPAAAEPNSGMREVNEPNIWYFAQLLGGALPIAGYLIGQKSSAIGKMLVVAGAVFLLLGLRAFDEIGSTAIRNIIIPATLMLVAAPFFGRMPSPEEEGRGR